MTDFEAVSPQILRIMDASINRAAEGLRFLEDTARFLLNDEPLTRQLKTLRHDIIPTDWPLQKQLVQSRDAAGDVGAELDVAGSKNKKTLHSAVAANSRRVQEALRTLEELSKIHSDILPGSFEKYQQARFQTYTIEKLLVARLLRQDKAKLIRGLYAVIDTDSLQGRTHLDVAAQVIRGGAKIIQLRDKNTGKKALLDIAQSLKKFCAEKGALFIMNDNLDIALAVNADGLHIGQEDLPVTAARKLAPLDMLIGVSVFNEAQAEQAVADGADYLGVGAIFPTVSKDTVVLGLETLKTIKQTVAVPVVAIGGININNVAAVKNTGADSFAVIGALLSADSPEKAAQAIIKKFEE